MINTILLDLDGTLLHFRQDEFISAYFTELKKVFIHLGFDTELTVKGLWAGIKAMVQNSGERLNSDCFWEEFSRVMGLTNKQVISIESACRDFYSGDEFDSVKSILKNTDPELPQKIVRSATEMGFTVVLATNPLFPECAVTTRLSWIGLSVSDFKLVTHYENSTFCKPDPGYYLEIFRKIGKEPRECLMVGNSTLEDMSVGKLDTDTFLVNEYIENESEMDISKFQSGTLMEFWKYMKNMEPPVYV